LVDYACIIRHARFKLVIDKYLDREKGTPTMVTLTNYELLALYKRLTIDGLHRFALTVEEEIFMRMGY
jgi:hypothetical protein